MMRAAEINARLRTGPSQSALTFCGQHTMRMVCPADAPQYAQMLVKHAQRSTRRKFIINHSSYSYILEFIIKESDLREVILDDVKVRIRGERFGSLQTSRDAERKSGAVLIKSSYSSSFPPSHSPPSLLPSNFTVFQLWFTNPPRGLGRRGRQAHTHFLSSSPSLTPTHKKRGSDHIRALPVMSAAQWSDNQPTTHCALGSLVKTLDERRMYYN